MSVHPRPRIFLSYARDDDQAFVRKLCRSLTERGFQVWFDRDSLRCRGLTFQQEVRDAICGKTDCLIYVAGPKAMSSENVRREWALALELDHHVIPIQRLGETKEVLPPELSWMQCDDFRDDSLYDEVLARLIVNLESARPPLGALHDVPPLPPHLVTRAVVINAARDALHLGERRRVGLHGMGGIGKSVTAASLCRSQQLRRLYPDGIFWLHVGQHPRLPELLAKFARLLGRKESIAAGQSEAAIRELTSGKAMLVVLDDVWDRDSVAKLALAGPRSATLITTRDATFIPRDTTVTISLDLLDESEALQLLAATASASDARPLHAEDLPAEAHELVRECGCLPLAIALAGGMARERSWVELLDAFGRCALDDIVQLERDDPSHRSLWKAMLASVVHLGDPGKQRRFAELAVFAAGAVVPEQAVATMWRSTGELDAFQTANLVSELAARSMLRLQVHQPQPGAATERRISVHDLLHDCATRLAGDLVTLHDAIVRGYRAQCEDGWASGPDDGYFFHEICQHLASADRTSEAATLLMTYQWLAAKFMATNVSSMVRDLDLVTQRTLAGSRRTSALNVLQNALQQASHVLEGGYDQHNACDLLASQILARLQNRKEKQIVSICRAAREELQQRRVSLRPLTASLQAGAALLKTIVCETPVRALASVGRQLIASAQDDLVTIWATQSLRPEREVPVRGWVNALVQIDGEGIAVAGSYLSLCMPKGGEIQKLSAPHGEIYALASLPDGFLAVAASDKTIDIWNVGTGTRHELGRHGGRIKSLVALPGSLVVAGGDDKMLRVWDWRVGSEVATLEGHGDSVMALASLTSDRFVSGSLDGMVMMWDVRTGENTVVGYTQSGVAGLAMLGDGRLAVGTWAGNIELWNLSTRRREALLEGHTAEIKALLEIGDGRLLSASYDGTIKVWDTRGDGGSAPLNEGHRGSVRSLAALPDGRLVSGGQGGVIKLWSARTCRCVATLAGHPKAITSIAVSSDGSFASGASDGTIKIWRRRSFAAWRAAEWGSFDLPTESDDRIWDLAFLRDGSLVYSSTNGVRRATFAPDAIDTQDLGLFGPWRLAVLAEGCLSMTDGFRHMNWELTKPSHASPSSLLPIRESLSGPNYSANALTELPNGLLASCHDQYGKVWLWNPAEQRCAGCLEGHQSSVTALVALPNNVLASASEDRTVRLWWLRDDEIHVDVGFVADAPITSLAFLRKSSILCVGDESGRIHFLEFRPPQPPARAPLSTV